MIKAILSYSKKIPAEQEYSSQSYHLSLETELPDSLRQDEVRAHIHETFELVKQTVEQELSNGNGSKHGPADPGSNQVPVKGAELASNAQIKFLCDMARNSDISLEQLNERVRELYKVDSVYGLSKRDASNLITELKHVQKRAA